MVALYGSAAIEPLHKAFLTDQWPGTMWTMEALAKIKDERCLPIYIAALAHHEPNVRQAAIEGLKFNTGLDLGWQPEPWQTWWKNQAGNE